MIDAGYIAFNGYMFDQADADLYNQAVAENDPDNQHRVFMTIITQGRERT